MTALGAALLPYLLAAAAPPLQGLADLHVHPAMHLSLGADEAGRDGPFWGRPGLRLEEAAATLPADLAPCRAHTHVGVDANLVRSGTREQVIRGIESGAGFDHGPGGWPEFDAWPHARSLTHQAAHVSWIHRAYKGGLRLMIASVTDSQTLARLWRHGGGLGRSGLAPPDPGHDHASAVRQIRFIRALAQANAGWMEIVTSAAEARRAVAAGRLALILGLEMDQLTAEQILDLARHHGVRAVTPIHLVDNTLGGAAIFDDVFNGSNEYLGGRFFEVVGDPHVPFRLSARTTALRAARGFAGLLNVVQPQPLPRAEYCALGYECCPEAPRDGCIPDGQGHRNARGLSAAGAGELVRLMKAGLLLDVAHMSERAADEALLLAEERRYPLLYTHGSLRDERRRGSERAITVAQARRLTALGGVMGLSTVGDTRPVPLLRVAAPAARFTAHTRTFTWPLRAEPAAGKEVFVVSVTLRTGHDARRGDRDGQIVLTRAVGAALEFPLNGSRKWNTGQRVTRWLRLPEGTQVGDLTTITVRLPPGRLLRRDDWDLDELEVDALDDPVAAWVDDYREALARTAAHEAALGSDLNGLSPQVPFAGRRVRYPADAAARRGVPSAVPLPRHEVGRRTFDFTDDGLAHIGLVPDFMQALSDAPSGAEVVDGLCRSAAAVIRAWERAEAASRSMR